MLRSAICILLLFVLPTAACASPTSPASPPSQPPTALPTATVIPTPTPTPAATPTPIPTSTPDPTATATPDPYAGLTVADLAARAYGGGELRIEQTLAADRAFTRTLVIHPNLRNYPPSDEGPNPFRVGYAVDTLNLIALAQAQAGQPGPLRQADPNAIGLWGHSMGGGISLRAITVNADVQAVVLYGSMGGDEKKNHERILTWSGGERGQEELETPEEDLLRIF